MQNELKCLQIVQSLSFLRLQTMSHLIDTFADCRKLVPKIDVAPNSRLVEICDQKQALLPKDPGPCGNFSFAYRCLCDYRGAEVMEDVAWVSSLLLAFLSLTGDHSLM